MKKGDKLYVRVDYLNEGSNPPASVFEEHTLFVDSISGQRGLLGGKFCNVPGGMIIFSAVDINEAHEISKCDPLIYRGYFGYNLYCWEVLVSTIK